MHSIMGLFAIVEIWEKADSPRRVIVFLVWVSMLFGPLLLAARFFRVLESFISLRDVPWGCLRDSPLGTIHSAHLDEHSFRNIETVADSLCLGAAQFVECSFSKRNTQAGWLEGEGWLALWQRVFILRTFGTFDLSGGWVSEIGGVRTGRGRNGGIWEARKIL
jgi:hypothetical protein